MGPVLDYLPCLLYLSINTLSLWLILLDKEKILEGQIASGRQRLQSNDFSALQWFCRLDFYRGMWHRCGWVSVISFQMSFHSTQILWLTCFPQVVLCKTEPYPLGNWIQIWQSKGEVIVWKTSRKKSTSSKLTVSKELTRAMPQGLHRFYTPLTLYVPHWGDRSRASFGYWSAGVNFTITTISSASSFLIDNQARDGRWNTVLTFYSTCKQHRTHFDLGWLEHIYFHW